MRTGFVEARFDSRHKREFRLSEHKIRDRYKDSKFESLYWALARVQNICRHVFFLADSKKDLYHALPRPLPRIAHASSVVGIVYVFMSQ
jgi:hypothetical protein